MDFVDGVDLVDARRRRGEVSVSLCASEEEEGNNGGRRVGEPAPLR